MDNITKENIMRQLPSDPDGLYNHFQIKNGSSKEKRLLDLLINLAKKKAIILTNGVYQVGANATNRELTLLEQARLSEGKTANGGP